MIVFGIGGRVTLAPPAFADFGLGLSSPTSAAPGLVVYEMDDELYEYFREVWDCTIETENHFWLFKKVANDLATSAE